MLIQIIAQKWTHKTKLTQIFNIKVRTIPNGRTKLSFFRLTSKTPFQIQTWANLTIMDLRLLTFLNPIFLKDKLDSIFMSKGSSMLLLFLIVKSMMVSLMILIEIWMLNLRLIDSSLTTPKLFQRTQILHLLWLQSIKLIKRETRSTIPQLLN